MHTCMCIDNHVNLSTMKDLHYKQHLKILSKLHELLGKEHQKGI